MKVAERDRAIRLRKEGKSYSEILSVVNVAKSTLSEWFKEENLSKPQQQRMTALRRAGALRGARAREKTRLDEIESLARIGKKEVGRLTARELWLIGIALYWAEGSKQNIRSKSAGMVFGNMDHRMLSTMLAWLRRMGISDDRMTFDLYVHSNRKGEVQVFKQWWTESLELQQGAIQKVYLKQGNPKTLRSNTGDLYHGLLRIKVRSSTSLNRRIAGWTEGIVASLGGGVTGNTSAFEAEDSRIVP